MTVSLYVDSGKNIKLTFYDKDNVKLISPNQTIDVITFSASSGSSVKSTTNIIVPSGAVRLEVQSSSILNTFNEITTKENN